MFCGLEVPYDDQYVGVCLWRFSGLCDDLSCVHCISCATYVFGVVCAEYINVLCRYWVPSDVSGEYLGYICAGLTSWCFRFYQKPVIGQ